MEPTKVFISQPMRGKTAEQIQAVIAGIVALLGENFEVIDTFYKDFDGNRLQFLGKSIMDGLSRAHLAVFVDDWQDYDGCACENFVAQRYGVECKFYNSKTNELNVLAEEK